MSKIDASMDQNVPLLGDGYGNKDFDAWVLDVPDGCIAAGRSPRFPSTAPPVHPTLVNAGTAEGELAKVGGGNGDQ